ncbi:MAG TPA: glycoside hydrolase family 27 protein [Mycobacterium sp.]|nr:glycoside hydrolase family 27 protein [Mycobacterium sp.]
MRVRPAASIAVLTLVAVTQGGCSSPHHEAPALPALSSTPPMGWNSWDSGIDLTEQNVKTVIDAMVSSGMRDAGYRYVNLDAGWSAPVRGPDGKLRADPARFPDGIAGLARYAHDRGLLFGLYASPYNEGCSAIPALASAGHEATDAQTFADWGVDYLKYDWCRADADHDAQVRVFTTMRDALNATGRRILYSINPNSSNDYTAGTRYDWSAIADMTRATTDLWPLWRDKMPSLGPLDPFPTKAALGVPDEFTAATKVTTPSRPGYWNDADMLVVGLGWNEYATRHFTGIRTSLALPISDDQLKAFLLQQPNLTDIEQRTHFSLWAMLSAPLIAGNDIRAMSAQTRDILTDRDVIAVDQDPKVASARALPSDSRVLVKPLADGAVAVAFVNFSDEPATITTTGESVGLRAACNTARDLWSHKDTTTPGPLASGALAPHAVTLLRVRAGCR